MYAGEPAQIVYVSSRQAVDPGPAVPGYALSNWAVLQLPRVLKVNLGRSADLVSCFTLLLPFVRTGMTNEYAGNERVYGRWQPRMLEPCEMAEAFMALLGRPINETDGGMFELMVNSVGGTGDAEDAGPAGVELVWHQLSLNLDEQPVGWSAEEPLQFS